MKNLIYTPVQVNLENLLLIYTLTYWSIIAFRIVSNGTWRITYYYDTDQEETNTFNGYNFTFASGNVLMASNGTNNYAGVWSVTDSNSNDDSISDLDFNIAFTTPAQFEELTDDWEIIEKSATQIKLKDVSGGNGGTDYLTFTKN